MTRLRRRKQLRNLIVMINSLQALFILIIAIHIYLRVNNIGELYEFTLLPIKDCAIWLVLTSMSLLFLSTYLVTELNKTSELEIQLVNERTARDVSEQNLRIMRCHRHDFLNHLQVILGYMQLGKIQSAIDYIKGINEEMHGIRIISGLSMPEISILLLVMRQKALESGIRLEYNITTDLSGININQQDLVRILSNLIDNAIYELRDRINDNNKMISVTMKMVAKTFNIEVFNTGSYIPNKINIFKYGYTTKGDRGTGLGLYLVKEIVEKKYKGRIDLISEKEYGTKFSIAI